MRTPFKEYPIDELGDFATRLDAKQASPVFATKIRGLLNRKKGMVAERDWGTIHRYAVYPIRPNAFKLVSGAASSGADNLVRITTSTSHGFSTNDIISIDEIGGTTEAIGTWKITEVAGQPTKFDLVGSTFANAWTSGGICASAPINIVDAFPLYDQSTDTEYDVIVGTDSNTKTRFYVRSGSSWVELTQKINALINGAPSAPASITTTQVVTIDTPTDESSQVFTLGTDTLNGFVVYHAGSGTASFVLDSTATTITIPHNVTIAPFLVAGAGWINNDALVFFRCTGVYNSFNYANGASPHIRTLENGARKKLTLFYADNSGSSLVRKDPLALIYQSAARTLFPSVTAAVKATGTITGTSGAGDTVTINGIVFAFTDPAVLITDWNDQPLPEPDLIIAINSHPYISTLVTASGVGAGSVSVTLTAVTGGTAGNSITLSAVGLTVSGATLTGGSDESTSGGFTLPVGFYCEEAYFTVGFQGIGTIASPKLGTAVPATVAIGDGMQVSVTFSETANAAGFTHERFYLTAMYRGYEESDPICQIILDGSTSAKYPTPTITVLCDPAVINKDITGFRLYFAAKTNGTATQADWPEDASEYLLAYEKDIDGSDGWAYNNASPYCYSLAFAQPSDELFYSQLEGAAADSILDNLNHALVTSRTALQPLFATKANREQGAVITVDADQKTLRLSSYDGDTIHEDDNYPEVAVDNDAFKQRVELTGKGQLKAISQTSDVIFVNRGDEVEFYDLQGGPSGFLAEPCLSSNAVVVCNKGIIFPSTSGIRIIPWGGGKVETLNPLWDNLYDGSLLIDDDSASYITLAYRQASVGGYFENLEEYWWATQMNIDSADGGGSEYVVFRYSFRENRWLPRQIHIGSAVAPNLTVAANQIPVKTMRSRRDGTMMIVTSKGLLKYPYTGTLYYQDAVYYGDRTSDRGIPTDLVVNLGGLADAIPKANLRGVKINHEGSSVDKMGFASLLYYRNNDINTFETKRFRVDDPPVFREFERGGAIENQSIRIQLPSGDLDNHKKLDISSIVVGYDENVVSPGTR